MGYRDLPLLIIPHPFGSLKRNQVRELAAKCAADLATMLSAGVADAADAEDDADGQAKTFMVNDDIDAINNFYREQRWADGLPIVPPTRERVQRMLEGTRLGPEEVIALVAPGFGHATVERIAINAVMAGCKPDYLPVLIAAVEAVCSPEFNLQAIQTTTNPATTWLVVNGPIVRQLEMNFGLNCLGQGNWANATLGRALRFCMQNIGRALPGEMDRATHGQPGKYLFCCAENEDQNPWEPLHVERGLRREQSAVTVMAAEGTTNINTHSKNAEEIIRAISMSMYRPAGNDYKAGGEPWMIFGPEHAQILKEGGFSKAEVKARLWEESKMPVSLMSEIDMGRANHERRAELGELTRETLLPVSVKASLIGIIVAGGPGTHSVLVSSFGNSRSVMRTIR